MLVKKGFTLVELLVVIVILSLIAMVVYPAIIKVINDSKKDAYNTQVELVIKAAKEWAVEHPNLLPSDESSSDTIICVSELVSLGYIDTTVKNPYTSSEMPGGVVVALDSNKYEYVYNENACNS